MRALIVYVNVSRACFQEPGVVECVLNGIALLFVVTFDEKLFTLMVNKDHTAKFTMEIAHAHNRDAIFAY